MHELGGMVRTDDGCDIYREDAYARAWGHVRKKAPWVGRASGKESPRLMHVIVLHCALYLFWGAASVFEWGVLVRKENRSGVRKGSCD